MKLAHTSATVGVLALQGDFDLHIKRIEELGASTCEVRTAQQLAECEALIIPGGESTALLKLVDDDLREAIIEGVSSGLPTLVTCAGLILLAKEVSAPAQESFSLLSVAVERNAYGRQLQSFIDPLIEWTKEARSFGQSLNGTGEGIDLSSAFEGVFIRGPRIKALDPSVEVFATRKSQDNSREPVLVRQGNILGSAFHPELSANADAVHQMLLALVERRVR